MKKILMWSPKPLKKMSEEKLLSRNCIGSNTGNMLFHNSVARHLMVKDEPMIDTIWPGAKSLKAADYERMNAEYKLFAIPLANAFRRSYLAFLEDLSTLISHLKIPCVVIGVGMQADSAVELQNGLPFDEKITHFVKLVLEHSAMLGVRGGCTADYLKRLGFCEETDFTVIGCPSMFYDGGRLPLMRFPTFQEDSKIVINAKLQSDSRIHEFMAQSCAKLPNYWYVPQRLEELWLLREGIPMLLPKKQKLPDYFPLKKDHFLLKKGRCKAFLNEKTWVEFMRGMDFTYGCNIHGGIASILAGTPDLIIYKDMRVFELADYFEIPGLRVEELERITDIRSIAEKMDYSLTGRNHIQRFEHYRDFLNANGIEHIFQGTDWVDEAPYDRLMNDLGYEAPLEFRAHRTFSESVRAVPVYGAALKHSSKRIRKIAARKLKLK